MFYRIEIFIGFSDANKKFQFVFQIAVSHISGYKCTNLIVRSATKLSWQNHKNYNYSLLFKIRVTQIFAYSFSHSMLMTLPFADDCSIISVMRYTFTLDIILNIH